jgi:hypothetical protein
VKPAIRTLNPTRRRCMQAWTRQSHREPPHLPRRAFPPRDSSGRDRPPHFHQPRIRIAQVHPLAPSRQPRKGPVPRELLRAAHPLRGFRSALRAEPHIRPGPGGGFRGPDSTWRKARSLRRIHPAKEAMAKALPNWINRYRRPMKRPANSDNTTREPKEMAR